MAKARLLYQTEDGVEWRVDVRNPSSSHALVVFTHPDARSSRQNRYAHFTWLGPEAQNISSRIEPSAVMALLDEATLARLFRRSMAIAGRPSIAGRVV